MNRFRSNLSEDELRSSNLHLITHPLMSELLTGQTLNDALILANETIPIPRVGDAQETPSEAAPPDMTFKPFSAMKHTLWAVAGD